MDFLDFYGFLAVGFFGGFSLSSQKFSIVFIFYLFSRFSLVSPRFSMFFHGFPRVFNVFQSFPWMAVRVSGLAVAEGGGFLAPPIVRCLNFERGGL